MKSKLLLLLFTAILLTSCKGGNSKAEEKALNELYAEGISSEQIESVTSEPTDSVLSPVILGFLENDMARAANNCINNTISQDSCLKLIDDCNRIADDVLYSYKYGIAVNDSLHGIYGDGEWRRVYKVNIKTKFGREEEIKVITDEDGETPFCTGKELLKKYQDYQETMAIQRKYIY